MSYPEYQPYPKTFNLKNEPKIGANCSLVDVLMDCSEQITIGDNVAFGHGVMLLCAKHDYSKFGKERMETSTSQPITIENGAWIASGAIICGGVTIGHDSVVGANSVVTKDIPPKEVWGGVPAIPIKLISMFPKRQFPSSVDSELANYIAGFVDGEGSFSITKNGEYDQFRFYLESDYRDKELYEEIVALLGCGTISERRRLSSVNKVSFHAITLVVRDKPNLINKIIPFFDTYELRGLKKIKYQRWREKLLEAEAAKFIKEIEH